MQADFLPGAERLLQHLKKHSVPCCVATSSTQKGFDVNTFFLKNMRKHVLMIKKTFQAKTQRHREKFDNFFTHVVTGSDPEIKEGKPAPGN